MLLIPDLSHTSFKSLSARLICDLGEFAPDVAKQLQIAFAGTKDKVAGCDLHTFRKPYLLSLDVDDCTDDRGGHVEIDVGIIADFALGSDSEDGFFYESQCGTTTVREFQTQLKERLGILDQLALITEGTCHFVVALDDLPAGGIIRRGVGARAEFGDDVLRLSGAQFAINGDVDHTISWFVDPVLPDWNSIEGSIFSRESKVLNLSLLSDILETAQERLERYVLESTIAVTK